MGTMRKRDRPREQNREGQDGRREKGGEVRAGLLSDKGQVRPRERC